MCVVGMIAYRNPAVLLYMPQGEIGAAILYLSNPKSIFID
jgi:hypothetical protein